MHEEIIEEKHYRCRCCGMKWPGLVWYPNGGGTYGICGACGCESGLDDHTMDRLYDYRQEWIALGMQWWVPGEEPPKDWNPIENLKHIPKEYL